MYIKRKQIDGQLKPGRDDSDWKEREGVGMEGKLPAHPGFGSLEEGWGAGAGREG